MKITKETIELIKKFEGFKAGAYKCSAGVLTCGYGSTHINGKPVKLGDTITETEAEEELIKYLNEEVISKLNKIIHVPINDNQLSAILSFIYNIGFSAFRSSSILRNLNDSKKLEAGNSFLLWDKVTIGNKKVAIKGLTNRRITERKIFLTEEKK